MKIFDMNYQNLRVAATRSKSLSKMMRIVQNERCTIEIDSENALLNCTWNAEDSRALFSVPVQYILVASFRRFKIGSFSVAGVCHSREILKYAVVSAQMIAPPMALAPQQTRSFQFNDLEFQVNDPILVQPRLRLVGLFTICDSSDLQMAFWWHKEAISGYVLAERSLE